MGEQPINFKDGLYPQGRVEIFTTRGKPRLIKTPNDLRIDFSGCELLDVQDLKNIIVNYGKDYVISGLCEEYTPRRITRMAIGDRGTIPSDSTVPKVPVATMTALYNEVFRSDVDGYVKNVGTASVHEVKFVKTFSASGIPVTAFSNQSKPVINEVALIMIDPAAPTSTHPLTPRPDVSGPYFYPTVPLPIPAPVYPYQDPFSYPPVDPYWYPPTDEIMFAIRTYKSVPFEVANDISVTIRYTIYIE